MLVAQQAHCICAIGAKEYSPSPLVTLLNCSNLAVLLFLKATAKQAVGILIPQQHKCATVSGQAMMTVNPDKPNTTEC